MSKNAETEESADVFVDTMLDFGFKKMFGEQDSAQVLIEFLNSLFSNDPDYEPIVEITYLDKEILGETRYDRASVFDINCKTSSGKHLIIEMQKALQPSFTDRTIYYLSKGIAQQAEKGEWNYKLTPVHCVAFLNFINTDLERELVNSCGWVNIKSGKLISDTIRATYIQLPLFDKTEQECETIFEKIIYTFKNMKSLRNMPYTGENNIFKFLEEKLSLANLTKEERWKYEEELKIARDNKATLTYAIDQATAKALEEGRAEGRAEGTLAMIRKLLGKGKSKEEIIDLLDVDPKLFTLI